MAYSKGGEEPSDTKMAMLDRTVAHMVRSIGENAHTDDEFDVHLSKPDQQRKLTMFRLLVSLIGATKLAIKGVPLLQPDLGYALRVFDHLDKEVVVGEYGLPYRQVRKTLKRSEDLKTLIVMQAVASVFGYKQVRRPARPRLPKRFQLSHSRLTRASLAPCRRRRSCSTRASFSPTASLSHSAGRCSTT